MVSLCNHDMVRFRYTSTFTCSRYYNSRSIKCCSQCSVYFFGEAASRHDTECDDNYHVLTITRTD